MLPSGYTQLEYIQSSGTQYINTGVAPNNNTRVVFDYEPISTRDTGLFGSRTSTSSSDRFLVIHANDTNALRTDYRNTNTNTKLNPSGRTVIDKDKNVTTIGSSRFTNTSGSFSSSCAMGLFCINTGGTFGQMTSIRLYSCQIYNNDSMLRNFVPCKSSSGTVGLYDTINDVFYTNPGSTNFIAGPEFTFDELKYIQSSGTQYIDTGFNPDQNTRIIFDFRAISIYDTGLFGSRSSVNGTDLFLVLHATDYDALRSDYGGNKQDSDLNPTERIVINKNKNVTQFGALKTITHPQATFSSSYTAFLFAVNNGGEIYKRTSIELYACKIYDNGELIRDFIPCKLNDGTVGLYDTVFCKFYENSGTGSFIAGPLAVPDPPTNLKASISNKTVYLSWNASPSEDVDGYNVYLDDNLIGTTASLSYAHAISPSQTYTISVVAYSESGESDPVSISVYYELPNPPTNLDATFDKGIIHLLWTDSTTENVTGYRIYQNGVLVTTTPAVFSLFEFPFSNESLTENLLELSTLERVQFYQSIDPYTEYTFSVAAFNKYGESDPVSINVYYEITPDITSVSLIPNPVFTEESLTISVFVDTLYNVTIT